MLIITGAYSLVAPFPLATGPHGEKVPIKNQLAYEHYRQASEETVRQLIDTSPKQVRKILLLDSLQRLQWDRFKLENEYDIH
jgi:hypothetical protein